MDSALRMDNPVLTVFLVVSFLSLLPAILVMFTSFTRIVVVLSFLRQAIGSQQIPPNPVVIGLSLFLTLFVMYPTVDAVQRDAVTPYLEKRITLTEALKSAEPPVKSFMLRQTREKDIALFLKLGKETPPAAPKDLPMRVLVPAFAISELKSAFQIGFLLFLPFLIIDMVVASVLLSMGMMMLPPVMVSLPFKLLLFVLVDGWNLIVGSIVRSFQ
ncbi:MAG: flagellar type III secretion system pore protein FliP [Thermodesulfobacteriota bacterium]